MSGNKPNCIDSVEAKVLEIKLGIFIFIKKFCKIGYIKHSEKIHIKLSWKPISYAENGLNNKIIIPARDTEFTKSYLLPIALEASMIKDIIDARTTDAEKEHNAQ